MPVALCTGASDATHDITVVTQGARCQRSADACRNTTQHTAWRLLNPLTHCPGQPRHAYYCNACTIRFPAAAAPPPPLGPPTCTKSAPAANMSTACCPQLTPPTPMSVSSNRWLSIMPRAVRTKSSAAWRMGAPQTPLVVRSGPKAGDPSWSSTVLKETREREDNGSVESAASGQQQQQQLTGKC
jgi:hypothetical protein